MMSNYFSSLTLISILTFSSCEAQPTQQKKETVPVGGNCETCELMFEGIPDKIESSDTSAGWYENAQKLIVTGRVFQADGKTPAPNILIYYWHTDAKGLYSNKTKKGNQHGYLRGWVRSDSNGQYKIHTLRPAPYPNEKMPAHIHVLIKEPTLVNPYYVDDLVFDEDPFLIQHKKQYPLEERGGNGILRVLLNGKVQVAEHDIILGLNIPNHPATKDLIKTSGLSIGQDQPSFIPYHAYGPDKGSRACPVCKYGRYHGIIFYTGNKPNWPSIKQWLQFLEVSAEQYKDSLKAYFVYGDERNYNAADRQQLLEALGKELKLQRTALTYVPSMNDQETEMHLNKIDPNVENTIIIYKHRRIVGKFVNLSPTEDHFKNIKTVIETSKGKYFGLKGLPHE
jgi:protocatechuate 3,4-dioxygenase, beta subunit